jgi:polyisoprenoid-binding protein YceI
MKSLVILLVWILGMPLSDKIPSTVEFVSGKVEFRIKNMGLAVNGTMNISSVQFNQPSTDPATWSIEGSAVPATISTGIELRDKHLKRSDYFDITNYPAIRLQSNGIKPKGGNKYEGTFNLTVKNVTKTVIIPFSILKEGKSSNIEGEFTINRLDYGIGEESTILSDNVKIKVSALFKIL